MLKWTVDKNKYQHKYTDLYGMLFHPRRCEVRKLLEVGIRGGQSMMSFHEFFWNAEIYGLEILQEHVSHCRELFGSDERIHCLLGNSQDNKSISTLPLVPQSFDVILDDGAHEYEAQERTLSVLWTFVRPGGFYIVEDVEFGHNRSATPHSIPWLLGPQYMNTLTQSILESNDVFFANTALGHPNWTSWAETNRLDTIDRIAHNNNLVVIQKRVTPLPLNVHR